MTAWRLSCLKSYAIQFILRIIRAVLVGMVRTWFRQSSVKTSCHPYQPYQANKGDHSEGLVDLAPTVLEQGHSTKLAMSSRATPHVWGYTNSYTNTVAGHVDPQDAQYPYVMLIPLAITMAPAMITTRHTPMAIAGHCWNRAEPPWRAVSWRQDACNVGDEGGPWAQLAVLCDVTVTAIATVKQWLMVQSLRISLMVN